MCRHSKARVWLLEPSMHIPYSKKPWQRKSFGEFGKSPQFANSFANFLPCSVSHSLA